MSEKQLSLVENHQAEIKLFTEQICRGEQNYVSLYFIYKFLYGLIIKIL